MGNFAENLNLGNRFRPPLDNRKVQYRHHEKDEWCRNKLLCYEKAECQTYTCTSNVNIGQEI